MPASDEQTLSAVDYGSLRITPLSSQIRESMDKLESFLSRELFNFGAQTVTVSQVLVLPLVLIAGIVVIRVAGRIVNRSLVGRQVNPDVVQDFRDNALVFEAFFWVKAERNFNLRQVRSDVRFAIEKLFREHGVVVAFPQRDVHVDGSVFVDRAAPHDERSEPV